MAHCFVVVLLEGFDSSDEKEEIEESINALMSPYDTGSISGDYNERGFYDSYAIGGRFDGAINGLPNYYHRALVLSENNPDKDYGLLFRQLASEELKRNSCKVDQIRFPSDQDVLPGIIVLPNGSMKEMPELFPFPHLVRTREGNVIEEGDRSEAEASREAWRRAWAEIVKDHGDRLAVGLDCHC